MHARASTRFLTGVPPKYTTGSDLLAGISMDQIARASDSARTTQLASLELAWSPTESAGTCDPGYSCAYTNTISWRTPTTPLPMENNPRAVFERLFGDSGTHRSRSCARRGCSRTAASSTRSRDRVARCSATLGTGDRAEADRVPRRGARRRAAHPEGRGAERRSCRSSSSRPAFPPRSPSTRS